MKAQKESSKKRIIVSFAGVLFSLCLCLGVYTMLRPSREFSQTENRKLAAFPHFSVSALLDGSYTKDISTWFNDQFAGRDMWTGLNLNVKKTLGQKENGGVYIGKKGQLYLKPEEPNMQSVNKNVQAMNDFSKQFKKVSSYVCIVPNAVTVQGGNLPKDAPIPDQKQFLSDLGQSLENQSFIDVSDALEKNNDQYIYYLTDHHWTGAGAQTAFEEIAAQMKLGKVTEDYEKVTVADDFRGTLCSKSGATGSKDTVEAYLPKTDIIYSVEYVSEKEKTATIYKTDALQSNDKYTIFFGGNHPRIDINTTAQTGRNLLVFKDSYYNCLAQFMWPYFDSIIIVDPRYYYEYAGNIVKQENITDVLYLYNADTFGTDSSLYAVLEAPAK